MTDTQIKSRAISGTLWKFAERMGAQIVSTIVSIILARLLLPEDYSIVSIAAIFFSFCNIFITSGLSSGLVQQKKVDELDFSTVLFANLFIALVLYLIIFFTAPYIADLYSKPILIPVFRVMGLNYFVYLVKSVFTAKISRTMEFKKFFWSTIIGTVCSAFVGIIMAYKGCGAWSLIAQQSTNALIDTIFLAYTTKIKFRLKFSFQRLKPIFKFSWKTFASNFLGTVYAEIKALIIGLKYTTLDLAFYNKGENFPRVISSSLDGTLSAVLFPAISRVSDDKDRTLSFIRRFFKISTYVIFPAMLGLLALTENFINVVLTSKWLPMAPYFRVFCIYYTVYFITFATNQIYKAVGRPDILLKLEIIKDILSLVVVVVFLFFSKTVFVFSLTNIVTIFLVILIESVALKKYVNYKFTYQLLDIATNLISALIMFFVVSLVGKLSINIYYELFLQVVLGIFTYLVVNIVTKNENYIYVLNLLKGYIKKQKH